jgi:hypothetical protein
MRRSPYSRPIRALPGPLLAPSRSGSLKRNGPDLRHQKHFKRLLHLCLLFGLILGLTGARELRLAESRLPKWQKEIFSEIEALYLPFARERNQTLSLLVRPDSRSVVASAEGDKTQAKVIVHGGLLRSKRLTADGLRSVLCHEIGHVFGGTPKRRAPMEWDGPMTDDGFTYVSSEGQADYYSTAVCFRRLVKGQNHASLIDHSRVTPRLARLCDFAWGKDTEDSWICKRAALGGENLLLLVADFPISFETPDRAITRETLGYTYPSRQCRLDTILAGALCRRQLPLDLALVGKEEAACGETEARRPACWFLRD